MLSVWDLSSKNDQHSQAIYTCLKNASMQQKPYNHIRVYLMQLVIHLEGFVSVKSCRMLYIIKIEWMV